MTRPNPIDLSSFEIAADRLQGLIQPCFDPRGPRSVTARLAGHASGAGRLGGESGWPCGLKTAIETLGAGAFPIGSPTVLLRCGYGVTRRHAGRRSSGPLHPRRKSPGAWSAPGTRRLRMASVWPSKRPLALPRQRSGAQRVGRMDRRVLQGPGRHRTGSILSRAIDWRVWASHGGLRLVRFDVIPARYAERRCFWSASLWPVFWMECVL